VHFWGSVREAETGTIWRKAVGRRPKFRRVGGGEVKAPTKKRKIREPKQVSGKKRKNTLQVGDENILLITLTESEKEKLQIPKRRPFPKRINCETGTKRKQGAGGSRKRWCGEREKEKKKKS